MNNVNIAKIVQDRLPALDLEAIVTKQMIQEDKVTIGLFVGGDIYEYTITKTNVERKIKSDQLHYVVIDALEYFFEDLRGRVFSENSTPGQMSILDKVEIAIKEDARKLGEKVNAAVETKKIEVVDHADEPVVEADFEEKEVEQKCRICGCTQSNACEGGCYWVEDDLCNKCAEGLGVDTDSDTVILTTSDETKKDDTLNVEESNVAENSSNEEIETVTPFDSPLKKVCEKCGAESLELDVNNECPTCATNDSVDSVELATPSESPFSDTITASF